VGLGISVVRSDIKLVGAVKSRPADVQPWLMAYLEAALPELPLETKRDAARFMAGLTRFSGALSEYGRPWLDRCLWEGGRAPGDLLKWELRTDWDGTELYLYLVKSDGVVEVRETEEEWVGQQKLSNAPIADRREL